MAADTSGVNGVALAVLIVLFALVTVAGFMASRFGAPTAMESLDEWGLGGRKFGTWITWFLLGGDLYTAYTFVAVPAAMFATGAVAGLLRGALHDRALPDHLHLHGAAVVGEPPARLRHDGRLRPRPVRRPRAVARRRGHRLRRDHALHRAAARRHPGGARGGRPRRRRQHHRQGPAAVHRVRAARGLHLLQRPAGAGGHRVRQGHPDLPRHHRRDHLPARQGRRLGRRSSAPRRTKMAATNEVDRQAQRGLHPGRRRSTGPTPPSPSARRWRCSCTRTR